jgi:hypothetical protein
MTLVEMMIAMALFMIVSSALWFILRSHVNMNKPLMERSQMIHDARAAYDIISRECRHAAVIIDGDTDHIEFEALINGSYRTYWYRLNGNELERKQQGFSGYQTLVENATDLEFQYTDILWNNLPTPVDSALSRQVAAIHITVGVALPDFSDTVVLSGRVSPRNID